LAGYAATSLKVYSACQQDFSRSIASGRFISTKQFKAHPVNFCMKSNVNKKPEHTAYLLARLPIGLSFLGHGLIRLTKLETFSKGMVEQFNGSLLPTKLVSAFGHVLPFLEFITGLLLLLGLFTRFAIILGAVVIMILIIGCSLIEQWNAIFTQLFYSAYLATLYYFTAYNVISVDDRRQRRK